MRAIIRLVVISAVVAGATAAAPQLVAPVRAACGVSIHEIYYNSPGTDTGSNTSLNGEWIKLKNSCSTGKSLYHWTVRDASAHVYTFGTYTLGAGSTVKVHTGKGSNTSTDRYWGMTAYVWNNSGSETAKLKNASGTLIDSCTYSGASAGYVFC